jgi:hypothetical protein
VFPFLASAGYISTPEAFKKAVLAAKSISHSDPAVPNLAGAEALAISISGSEAAVIRHFQVP